MHKFSNIWKAKKQTAKERFIYTLSEPIGLCDYVEIIF